MFPIADSPSIIRSFQKDEYHGKSLFEQAYDVFALVFGPRRAIAWQREVRLVCDMFHFGTSTLLGRQTLGEEYCDLVQLSSASDQLLPLPQRLHLGCWSVVLPYFYARLIARISSLEALSSHDSLGPIDGLLRRCAPHLPLLRGALQRAQRLHLALFYLGGAYYEWAKRMAGVVYRFNRSLLDHQVQYQLLGMLLLVQLAVSSCLELFRVYLGFSQGAKQGGLVQMKDEREEAARIGQGVSQMAPDCQLCMSPRVSPTTTPCGHIFCWNCIHEALQVKKNHQGFCPLCRQSVTPQELICLYNVL